MPQTIMMFCGQGAQYYQMGREAFDAEPAFRHYMSVCDEIAGDLGGQTISEIIYGRPLGESAGFDRVRDSNPALLAIGWVLAMVLLDRGVKVDRLLGYSLGETIAAVVADALSLEDGFRVVNAQARVFETLSPEGGMVAVLADPDQVAPCCEAIPSAEITARNTPTHCVISLLKADMAPLSAALDARGMTHARLPIRYPYHARHIEPLAGPIQAITASVRIRPPRWPIVSSTTAAIVDRFDGAHLWAVMRRPLHFREAIEALAEEGEWTLVEAGPSGTLCAFTRQIGRPGLTPWPAIDQFGQNKKTLERLVAAVT